MSILQQHGDGTSESDERSDGLSFTECSTHTWLSSASGISTAGTCWCLPWCTDKAGDCALLTSFSGSGDENDGTRGFLGGRREVVGRDGGGIEKWVGERCSCWKRSVGSHGSVDRDDSRDSGNRRERGGGVLGSWVLGATGLVYCLYREGDGEKGEELY